VHQQIFDLILRKRFEKRHGHQKVLKGEFAIEEGTTGKDVSCQHEFCLAFHPGQKIDMSMVFSDFDSSTNHCPRCGTKSEASAEVRTQWSAIKLRRGIFWLILIQSFLSYVVPEAGGN
jgi:hypothetical protein